MVVLNMFQSAVLVDMTIAEFLLGFLVAYLS